MHELGFFHDFGYVAKINDALLASVVLILIVAQSFGVKIKHEPPLDKVGPASEVRQDVQRCILALLHEVGFKVTRNLMG